MSEETARVEAMYVQHQLSIPKATQGLFELPCGFLMHDGTLLTSVKVREITGVEEDLLAAKNIPAGKKVTQLISNCIESLGSVTDKTLLVNMTRDLMVGDRVFLMMAIRRVTLGNDFPFEKNCPHCKQKRIYSVDLAGLESKRMADPTKRVYDVTLPSGKSCRFHVMTGREEESLTKLMTGNVDEMSLGILVRIDAINETPPTLDAVKALGMGDRNYLRDMFDEVEGGIDTKVDLECGSCGSAFETELDAGQAGFFFPSRIRKNSKVKSSS